MSLIKCPECGKKVSDKAVACPHCGCPISTEHPVQKNGSEINFAKDNRDNSKKRTAIVISSIIVAVFLVTLIIGLWSSKNNGNSSGRVSNCKDGLHQKGSWELTKEATLSDVGVEELFCSICGETLDSRGTECKKAKVEGKSFNFKDEEFIKWVNGWDKKFEISSAEIEMSNLSPSNSSYAVELESTGSEGVLILNHNENGNVSGIMAYFEEPIESAAFISVIAQNIEYDFSTENAGEELIDNKMAYTVGKIVVMRIQLDNDFEVTLLAPFEYMGEILAGSSLTKNDCLIFAEKNSEKFAKYNFNVQKYIQGEFGEGSTCYFFHDDGGETIEEDIGDVMTFRGIALGDSTEEDAIAAYGIGNVQNFDKNSDVLYQTLAYHGKEEIKYLNDTAKVILYNYQNSYQIALYIDNDGIVDFIAYFDGVWY